MKSLAEVIQVTEFNGIRLVAVEAQVVKGPQGSAELSVRTGITKDPVLVPHEGKQELNVACILEIGSEPAEQETAALKMKAVLQVRYLISDLSIGIEDLQEFIQKNIMFNAWPFFRELVLTTSVRMECKPVYLPLLKLGNHKPQIGSKATSESGHS